MANTAVPTAAPTPQARLSHTTKRGFATAAFCLGLWGTLTFWWYPFGIAVAALGLTFAVFSLAMASKRLFWMVAVGYSATVAAAVGGYVGLVPFTQSAAEQAGGPTARTLLANPLVVGPAVFAVLLLTIFLATRPVKRWGIDPDVRRIAWLGALFGFIGVNMAVGAYRYVQLAFEGSPPIFLTAIWPF